MQVRDIIRRLDANGWVHIETRGSHRQFKHPVKPGKVTVSGQPGDDASRWLIYRIGNQAGIRLTEPGR